jgi:hypothetical protein
VFEGAGFVEPRVSAHIDCFAGTSKERTARRYRVVGVEFVARIPD